MKRDIYLRFSLRRMTWRGARSAARVPISGTTFPTPITGPGSPGSPTCSGGRRSPTGPSGASPSARSASSPAGYRNPSESFDGRDRVDLHPGTSRKFRDLDGRARRRGHREKRSVHAVHTPAIGEGGEVYGRRDGPT